MKRLSNVRPPRPSFQVGKGHIVPRSGGPTCEPECPPGPAGTLAVTPARPLLPGDTEVRRLSEMFFALANPTRLRLLLALRPSENDAAPELCVCDLADLAEASQSMVSHQLRLLRSAGMVAFRRDGKLALYRIADAALTRLLVTATDKRLHTSSARR